MPGASFIRGPDSCLNPSSRASWPYWSPPMKGAYGTARRDSGLVRPTASEGDSRRRADRRVAVRCQPDRSAAAPRRAPGDPAEPARHPAEPTLEPAEPTWEPMVGQSARPASDTARIGRARTITVGGRGARTITVGVAAAPVRGRIRDRRRVVAAGTGFPRRRSPPDNRPGSAGHGRSPSGVAGHGRSLPEWRPRRSAVGSRDRRRVVAAGTGVPRRRSPPRFGRVRTITVGGARGAPLRGRDPVIVAGVSRPRLRFRGDDQRSRWPDGNHCTASTPLWQPQAIHCCGQRGNGEHDRPGAQFCNARSSNR